LLYLPAKKKLLLLLKVMKP